MHDERDKSLTRRKFLGFTAAAAGSLIMPAAHARLTPTSGERKLHLFNTHTSEHMIATYWADGRYQSDVMAELSWILRDHRADEATAMDPKLLDMLYGLQRRLDYRGAIHVISAYRTPATNTMLRRSNGGGVAKKSLHMQGKAIDVRLPKYDLRVVRKAALNLKAGGVGYYPRSNFLHLDTGRVRQWG